MLGGSLKPRGTVRAVLRDNIDTDVIYPGRYLNITDREKTAEQRPGSCGMAAKPRTQE